jgi:hypothetical protein
VGRPPHHLLTTTAPTGQAWTTDVPGWTVTANQARYSGATAGSYFTAVIDSGHADATVTADIILPATGDQGLCLRRLDQSNFIMLDFSGSDGSWVSRTFEKIAGALTGVTTLTNLTGVVSGTPFTVKAVMAGTQSRSRTTSALAMWHSAPTPATPPCRPSRSMAWSARAGRSAAASTTSSSPASPGPCPRLPTLAYSRHTWSGS